MQEKKTAPGNRTLTLSVEEEKRLLSNLLKLNEKVSPGYILNKTINQDFFDAVKYLPDKFADLVFVDPPYNLYKEFNSMKFKQTDDESYEEYLDSWLKEIVRLLKPEASIYICGDWRSSSAIYRVAKKYFQIQNRITWEREKGRGAKSNWKNCIEDTWFCTLSKNYTFNIEAVKLKKRVIAPYKDENRKPKDWNETASGNYRITHPSNIWTDISIPFWSMPENTSHPTQKPEKLLAKIILASSNPGDVVFDPFLGSGTTSVVAKKLKRNYVGIEMDTHFSCLAEKRLELAEHDKSIQGYSAGVFWERNTLAEQMKDKTGLTENLFDLTD